MLKQIIITVDTTEENLKIESFVKKFVEENFQKYKEATIQIDNIIPCPVCKDNQLIGCPVNKPTEHYYCHWCNKSFKKEEIENAKI